MDLITILIDLIYSFLYYEPIKISPSRIYAYIQHFTKLLHLEGDISFYSFVNTPLRHIGSKDLIEPDRILPLES